MTSLALNRLSRRECVALIEEVTNDKKLPAEVLEQIVVKTDGIHLFVEELTRATLDSGLLSVLLPRIATASLTSMESSVVRPTSIPKSVIRCWR